SIIRPQLKSLLVLSLGIAPAPFSLISLGQLNMCFGKLRIQLQCFPCRADHLRTCLSGIRADKNHTESVVRLCKTNVSQGKCRVFLYCLIEVPDALFKVRADVAVAQCEPAFEIALIHFRCDVTRGYKPRMFLSRDRHFDSARD